MEPRRSRLSRIARWLDERLHVTQLFAATAGHQVPRSAMSWFYVFGSGTLLCFLVQVLTGVCLAFVYVPSADEAWTSLEYLTYQQTLGWFLRALHYWGSNFMVAVMSLHMAQVFLFGAFKHPRELTWISGCVLLFCVLGMAFTGQVLRFDQDAYWGLGIGAAILGRVPWIGADLVQLMLAGPIIAGETLSRFFTLHVFLIPGLILALVALHLRLVLTVGINEWPAVGKPVRKATYREEYEELLRRDGAPFYPEGLKKDLVFSGLLLIGIFAAAALFGPKGPSGMPDPTQIATVPKPDFYFLSVYAVMALLPPWLETFLMLTAPIVGIGVLFALPFLFGTGEKSWRRRPFAVLAVILVFLSLCTLGYLGLRAPWSPVMDAWSSAPVPVADLRGRTPLELHGALVLQHKQCRNCHALGGEGGERGPALDKVATRLNRDLLIRQVIQGGGNMPAYGKNIAPAEVEALVAFLQTLKPENEPPARDPSAPPLAGRP